MSENCENDVSLRFTIRENSEKQYMLKIVD